MGSIAFLAKGVKGIYRDRARLRSWMERVAREHGHSIEELSFVLLTDKELLRFNQRYLGHDDFTDVITFDLQAGRGVSGDVLMSLDRIRENARQYGVPLQHELRRVMVHGLLHLLGHGDKTLSQQKAMRALEDAWLSRY